MSTPLQAPLPAAALADLALSRSTVDRDAARRAEPALIEDLLADAEHTAVLRVIGDAAPVLAGAHDAAADHPVALDLVAPAEAAEAAGADGAVVAYLGTGERNGRVQHFVLVADRVVPPVASAPPLPSTAPDGWRGLRDLGPLLDATDAGLLTTAVALSHWHAAHLHCTRCGSATEVVQAGWARSCPSCGTEHYPRTDPAVIMTVEDPEGRVLLGRQARWPEHRFSTLAGFVEPGESLEAAVRREVFEEAGIVVGDMQYRGSQPWPFPCSLMLGFSALATSTDITVDGTELAQARWWSREELVADLASGELALPPRVSIARRLIEAWYGGPLDGDW